MPSRSEQYARRRPDKPTIGERKYLIVNADAAFSDSMVVREVDGELLVLDTRANRIHQLNSTASLIWRRLREGREPDAIAAELAVEFDVDAVTALRDVTETLSQFRALELLGTR